MSDIRIPPTTSQLAAFAAAAMAALVAAGAASMRPHFFTPYFGPVHPVVAVAVVAVLGASALYTLRAHGFAIMRGDTRGLALAAMFAVVFSLAVVLVDLAFGFPRDINVAWPWSLPFYVAMAFVAESVFHAIPLALAVVVLSQRPNAAPISHRLIWVIFVAVALLEPVFQLRAALSQGAAPSIAALYTAPHVFLFGLAELWVFRRFDFMAMLAVRLLYYLIWHIAWGHARLTLLF